MAEAMHLLNVHILDGANELTHWTGSPSSEGGELMGIDVSPTGGPPTFDYDTTGNHRKQEKFNVDTKIIGATETERQAFIDRYKKGTRFPNANISGLQGGRGWIVENATVKHNAENEPSILSIVLAETGPSAGSGGAGGGGG